MKIDELRQKIIEKYGSIHNFCKINENLTRATVYLVFAKKYAGNVQKQLMIIENAFNNTSPAQKKVVFEEKEIADILQNTKCNHCRLLRPNCIECKRKSSVEANAVFLFIKSKL